MDQAPTGAAEIEGGDDPMISGYTDTVELYRSAWSWVLRATDAATGERVVIKTTTSARPPAELLRRLEHERALLRALDVRGVPGIAATDEVLHRLGDGTSERRPALVLRDSGGRSLAEWIAEAGVPLAEALDIAVQGARVLAEIHSRGIIHRDVAPDNIVVNRSRGTLEIIDYGLAILGEAAPKLSEGEPQQASFAGTLAYIAPEQTGRTSYDVDARSDLYALGATLFHLFTGAPPFVEEEDAALIHAHVARRPPDACARRPGLPPALGRVLTRLLAKAPSERYASASLVAADLEAVQASLRRGDQSTALFIDAAHRGALPSPRALYGRHAALAQLRRALVRARLGEAGFALVGGAAGAGKTTLVEALREEAREGGCTAAATSCVDAEHSVPLGPLIDIVRQRLRQLLGDDALARSRQRLRATFGDDAPVLTDQLPELAALLGAPPGDASTGAGSPLQRRRALARLITGLAEHEPLVIIIDDLHLADGATLGVLRRLFTDALAGRRRLLVVATFRAEALGAEHPLSGLITSLREAAPGFVEIGLEALDREAIAQHLGDLFAPTDADIDGLAELCHERSGGNALHLRVYLTALVEGGAVAWEPTGGRWRWQLEEVRGVALAGAPDLLGRHVAGLPEPTLELLQLAACVGTTFTVSTVVALSGRSRAAVLGGLEPALRDGLLDTLELAGSSDEVRLRFAHEQLHAAIEARIDADSRERAHLQLGRLLRDSLGSEALEARLLEVVTHLGEGADLLRDEERLGFAELSLRAGRRAVELGAHVRAQRLLERALEVAGDMLAARAPALRVSLSLECAQAAAANVDFPAMRAHLREARGAATTIRERALAYEIEIAAAQSLRDPQTIPLCLDALRLVGVDLRADPRTLPQLRAVVRLRRALRRRGLDAFIRAPFAHDPMIRARARLLALLASEAVVGSPRLVVTAATRLLDLSLGAGLVPEAALALVLFGKIQLDAFNAREAAYACAEAALRLAERCPDRALRGLVFGVSASTVLPLRASPSELLAMITRAKHLSLEAGDLDAAMFSALMQDTFALHSGRPLADVERESQASFAELADLREETGAAKRVYAWTSRQVMLNLLGRAEDPARLCGEAADFDVLLPAAKAARDGVSLSGLRIAQAFLAYLFGEPELALPHIEALQEDATQLLRRFSFSGSAAMIGGLTCVTLARGGRRRRCLRSARRSLHDLRRLAADSPHLHDHRVLIVEAALLADRGRIGPALAKIERAIAAAESRGQLLDVGIAAEFAARTLHGCGDRITARAFAREARYAWERWGATAKLARCDAEFAHLLDPPTSAPGAAWRPSSDKLSAALDLRAVVRASHALAEELVYERLQGKIMQAALEVGAASRGALILSAAGGPIVAAWADVDATKAATATHAQPLAELADTLPLALIREVLRTGQTVSLGAGRGDSLIVDDPYLKRHAPRSILCAPITRASVVRGAIYLENERVAGCFTSERAETVMILAAQAAISIEIASLYRDLEATIHERTADLEEARAVAEAATQTKAEFLARMSHELRTPLNAILGYARLLERDASEAARGGLRTIHRSGAHLLELIDDILAMAQLDAGRLELRPTSVAVGPLVGGLLSMLQPRADERGIDLRARLGEALPTRLLADEVRLRQVLLNLLGNALKFTARGEVVLHVERFAAPTGGPPQIRFVVEDTGPGIPREWLHAIFTPFEQVGDPTQRSRGAGLGLAIARELTLRMGGEIVVDSVVGEGSRFTVTLPLVDDGASTSAEALEAGELCSSAAGCDVQPRLDPPSAAALAELRELYARGAFLELQERAEELVVREGTAADFLVELRRRAAAFDDDSVRELLGATVAT